MKFLMFFFFITSVSFSTDLFGQSKLEIPYINSNDLVIHRYAYTFSYVESAEQSEWVAYYFTPQRLISKFKRTDNFKIDPLVKSGTANNNDYKKSGYDRGHLAPAKDMSWSVLAMEESFFYGNISPQLPELNRKTWLRLEETIRTWATNYDTVFIVTGPILEKGLPEIGSNGVDIPNKFYKTILFKKNGKYTGTAYIIPNKPGLNNFQTYKTTINQVEKLTGIDFYYRLEDSIEERVENE